MINNPRTLVELLRWRAQHQPERVAYAFLPDGEREESTLTYGELDTRAQAIGAALQSSGAEGKPVLLLYPPDLEYITAFFGCLYAGALAVPAYPPRLNRSVLRLQAIVEDTQAALALTTPQIVPKLERLLDQPQNPQSFRLLVTSEIAATVAPAWHEPSIDGDTLAFLQYTSGSTATPKGVMVSHGNLLHNLKLVRRAFRQTEQSIIVGWLPLYHDMGMVGNVLQPLFLGAPSILMPPMAFLQRPIRWLHAISRYRATTSGGPNFAYDLCVRKTSPEQRANLDLSSWTVAFNGSEPVRAESIDRFASAFEASGFRRQAFYPCYGLAESTLFVSGKPEAGEPIFKTVSTRSLENNRVVEAEPGDENARTLVGCGTTFDEEYKIAIVNPETLTRCSPEEIGEIWVPGPSVARGYWNRPEETSQTFNARLADTGEGPFLRTGDIGFLRDGELFVTGRLKDLIIIRGLNYYPQDIERTVESSHSSLVSGGGAAFTFASADGEEQLVVVQEIERGRRVDTGAVMDAIRENVSQEHDVQLHAVVLIRPRSIPKTSSGKIQRHACLTAFLNGTLEAVAEWRASRSSDDETVVAFPPTPVRDELRTASPRSNAGIEAWLVSLLAAKWNVESSKIDARNSITRYGVDSLAAIELVHRVESEFGVLLPMACVLQGQSVAEIATQISGLMNEREGVASPVLAAAEETTSEHVLSYGQRALWFLHQLTPESTVYNIASAVRIRSELDREALRRAFQTLLDRHASLRTTFALCDSEPVQRVHERMEIFFQEEDALHVSDAALDGRLAEESQHRFDLEREALLRVRVFHRSPQEHVVLLVVHHLVADFWSLAVLVHELGILYSAETAGRPGMLPDAGALRYTDFARYQAATLAGSEGERLWGYWQKQLAGELPVLNLPTDRPRAAVQTYRGASQPFRLGASLSRKLRDLCRESGATLYMLLAAAFEVLLHRYTGQESVLVGSPAAGRSRVELSGMVGYFVNPVVLRADFSADPTFDDFLAQTRRTVLDAFEHQDYPFALLVERLQLERDPARSPLFQAMFIFQKTHLLHDEGLSSFALGERGARMKLGALELESMALPQRGAQFDLTLVMAETGEEIGGSLQYNTDLFDASTVERMAGHFETLLESVAEDSSRRVSALPILNASERRRMLAEWNDTARVYPVDTCIHHFIEAQAAQTPGAVALVFEDIELTYAELNARANRLARYLRKVGVRAEVPVGVCMTRTPEMMVGLLAILKAGGAYIPLDPAYPKERLGFMLSDSRAPILLTERKLAHLLPTHDALTIFADAFQVVMAGESGDDLEDGAAANNLAYIIYTSGSTGQPKGVMVSHRNVTNFFTGMDERIGCNASDTLLSVTSISFDISILELFWTLARGCRVVLLGEQAASGAYSQPKHLAMDAGMEFSLFYFASDEQDGTADKYRLLFEGAKFADRHGFAAVWTPERHFHAFGGLYPNPSVIGAALAAMTERVGIRAGSVVLPLHHPVRVAEEWSVVDNISKGRIGLAFASGWHADDFIFQPENYAGRKQLMFDGIELVQRLWRGETVAQRGGAGNDVELKIFPKPVQPELPIWITAAASAETFVKAGEIGANVLTHLLGQSIEEVASKIKLYREARARHGHDSQAGVVTLMLHTFVGEDKEAVRQKVRKPFANYLRTSIGLIANLIKSLHLPFDLDTMSAQDMDDLLAFAADRYFETSGLFGTPETCGLMVEQLKAIGVNEVACLVDFGVDVDSALGGLHHLNTLKELANNQRERGDYSLPVQASKYNATLLQCTPTMMKMLALNPETFDALKSLRALMLGGEVLPVAQAAQVKHLLPSRVVNMYGPTETTIWSATHEVDGLQTSVPIGRPIANTQLFILNKSLEPAPVGVSGELHIGGEGLARGYFNRPALTAEKFIPNPFGNAAGERLYQTGDVARYLPDGRVELAGRIDQQVKIRGYRIELGEIEAALGEHAAVREAVVAAREDAGGDKQLVAYVVPDGEGAASSKELRRFVKERLPEYMIPSAFVVLDALPLTPNGKLNRKDLPAPETLRHESHAARIAPRNQTEQSIAAIWQRALKVERVGVDDNFFDLGGHSLLMAQVHSQLQAEFKRELPLVKLLEHPTISALGKYLAQEASAVAAPRPNLDRAIKQREAMKRQKQTGRLRSQPS